MPNFREEKKIWKKGYKYVACLDEAGRGPLAGPVIAGVVVVPINSRLQDFYELKSVNDSKQISEKKRNEIYKILTNNSQIQWGVGRVSEKMIDKINILEATKLAMEKAIKKLKIKPDFLILDGKMKLDIDIPQKSIVKADEKVFSCSSASIIAKVYRDRIMVREHKKYPKYGFEKHKGYGTKYHYKMLKKYGYCKIHRKSFNLKI